ncbi:MAG: phosphoglycerate kinase [Crocinitomicaceae bacterium]|nr:phosphoglycerate kinase [Crocinitomicaceae bacterium]
MDKKTVADIELSGKKVLMRVDFNVPSNEGVITDETRIQAALPTIKYILEQGAALILMSHMGRPKGEANPKFSLKIVSDRLSEILDQEVTLAPDCIGAETAALAADVKPGQILMLENTRFHAAEEGKVKTDGLSEEEAAKADIKAAQDAMAKELASYADVYVNDAFGAAHRSHASTAVVAKYSDVAVAGLLMEKELKYLGGAVQNPERPFVAIIGGAKISGKLEVTEKLVEKCDTIIIGGGMAYTFQKALGNKIGKSIHEDELMDTALRILADAKANNTNLLLPVDNKIADDWSNDANTQIVTVEEGIPDEWEGLDIGPKSMELFADAIKDAKTVVWNGPMGCFEWDNFAAGTNAICQAVADSGSISIIGGGDSVSAVNKSGLADKMSHISTGGGASLEFLEGKVLPGVACLNDK